MRELRRPSAAAPPAAPRGPFAAAGRRAGGRASQRWRRGRQIEGAAALASAQTGRPLTVSLRRHTCQMPLRASRQPPHGGCSWVRNWAAPLPGCARAALQPSQPAPCSCSCSGRQGTKGGQRRRALRGECHISAMEVLTLSRLRWSAPADATRVPPMHPPPQLSLHFQRWRTPAMQLVRQLHARAGEGVGGAALAADIGG